MAGEWRIGEEVRRFTVPLSSLLTTTMNTFTFFAVYVKTFLGWKCRNGYLEVAAVVLDSSWVYNQI